ncbi:MAG: YciI family protein [Verrucomicrobia bacterium]|nr:YciI family protein [Verrucomicrobiota bacterium]
MQHICLGFFDEKRWETMSEGEQEAFMDECFAYDDELRRNGRTAGGEALQSTRNVAVTLRRDGGKVCVTDGLYAETKEQLGGFGVIEATDLNHVIQLRSKHPSFKSGIVEIRPADDLTEMIRESEQRRACE